MYQSTAAALACLNRQAWSISIGVKHTTISFASIIAMKMAINATDYLLVGTASFTWWSIIPSLIPGFITDLPINY